MYIAMVITCLIIIMGFYFRRSTVLFVFQGIWLWVLTGFNSGGVDYATNEYIFLHTSNKFLLGESLSFVYTFFKKLGLDYTAYLVITSLVAYIIIFTVIYQKNVNKCMVASLIYLYPGIDFVIQKRYFLCMSILLIAVQYLNKEGKKNKYFYILFVLLASLFHISAVFYLVPIIFIIISDKYRKKIIIAIVVAGFIFSKYAENIVSLIPFISASKVRLYFVELSQSSNLYKYLFWCCWQLFFLLIIKKIYKWTKKNNMLNLSIDNAYQLNLEFLCILPFYSFDPVFTRLYRPIAIVDYIAATSLINKGKRQYKIICECFIYMVFWAFFSFFIFYVAFGVGIDNMITTVFRNNIFINLFLCL